MNTGTPQRDTGFDKGFTCSVCETKDTVSLISYNHGNTKQMLLWCANGHITATDTKDGKQVTKHIHTF